MKIAVVGSGAIGCYYGGKLVASGQDVHFLMRRDLPELRRAGLRIRGPGEDIQLPEINCYASTHEIGASDIVLVAVKTTSNDDLPELLPPLVSEHTMIVTLQNGLGNEEYLANHFGAKRIAAGLCFIGVRRTAPGTIVRDDHGQVILGGYERKPEQLIHALAAALRQSGIDCRVTEDLAMERWRKLVWNIPFNGLSIAAGGVDTATILGDPELFRATRALMYEVIAAANKCGFSLERATADEQLRLTKTVGRYKPSTLLDFEGGNPLEIESIWGEPLRRAVAAGAEVPRLQQLYALLKSLDKSRRNIANDE